jgi:hypothetical protein
MTTISDFSCYLNQCNNSRPIFIQIQSWLNAGKFVHFQVKVWRIENSTVNSGIFFGIAVQSCFENLFSSWHYDVKKMTKMTLFDQVHNWSSNAKKKKTSPGKKTTTSFMFRPYIAGLKIMKRLRQVQHFLVFKLQPCRPLAASTWILSIRISSKVLWQ